MSFLFKEKEIITPDIDGLVYIPNFISISQEKELMDFIDQQPWLNDLKRRVQHYGYKYDYRARSVTKESYLGTLPESLSDLAQNLYEQALFSHIPDQVIINEYVPGQGISAHIDCEPCFGDVIASLSLGSSAMMVFEKNGQKEQLYLEPSSLVILSKEARYDWTHAIPARKSDSVDGFKVPRQRRLSATFRSVVL